MNPKTVSVEELARIVERFQAEGKKIVFTNGCFDLLHIGHVRYLREAKELGDVLVVGLNSDSSVRKIKGDGRPLVPEAERAEVLSALEFVDLVIIFEEETPMDLLERIKPDWHVKGGDYKAGDLPEKGVVEAYGGRIKTLALVKNRSTSNLIERIRQCRSS